MSSQPVPPPAPGPDGARPAQDWSPAPLASGDNASYADRSASTPAAPPSAGSGSLPRVEVEQFAPTRSPWPILAVVAAVLVAVLIIYTTTWRPAAKPSPSASPQPSAGQSSQPGSTAEPDPGQPFIAPGGEPSGSWEVVDHRWDANGLEALVRIKVTAGTLPYTLNVIDASGTARTSAQGSSLTPALNFQPISEGQEVEGWVRFGTERGETTIALLIEPQEQLSALPISG